MISWISLLPWYMGHLSWKLIWLPILVFSQRVGVLSSGHIRMVCVCVCERERERERERDRGKKGEKTEKMSGCFFHPSIPFCLFLQFWQLFSKCDGRWQTYQPWSVGYSRYHCLHVGSTQLHACYMYLSNVTVYPSPVCTSCLISCDIPSREYSYGWCVFSSLCSFLDSFYHSYNILVDTYVYISLKHSVEVLLSCHE